MVAWTRALESLDGLSVGDALGQTFFGPPLEAVRRIEERLVPPGPWRYTDDTEMALSIVEVLDECGDIVPAELARLFAARFTPNRGYGGGAFDLLSDPNYPEDWQRLAAAMFGGTGSYGNGAAMRVAPVGAYFQEDLQRVADAARASAAPTHAHIEGQVGAVAVALGAALLGRRRGEATPAGLPLLEEILRHLPASEVRDGIQLAAELPSADTATAARRLGTGNEVSAQDTVPFCLWVASRWSHDYQEALWQTVSGLGDRDTTCAIVGGMVVLQTGRSGIPAEWLRARERVHASLVGDVLASLEKPRR